MLVAKPPGIREEPLELAYDERARRVRLDSSKRVGTIKIYFRSFLTAGHDAQISNASLSGLQYQAGDYKRARALCWVAHIEGYATPDGQPITELTRQVYDDLLPQWVGLAIQRHVGQIEAEEQAMEGESAGRRDGFSNLGTTTGDGVEPVSGGDQTAAHAMSMTTPLRPSES